MMVCSEVAGASEWQAARGARRVAQGRRGTGNAGRHGVNRPVRIATAFLVGSAAWITACDTSPTAVAPSDPPALRAAVGDRSDGVRIYRAVFFGEGELVRVLPSPWREGGGRVSTAKDLRAGRLEAEIVEWIDASDPTFFADFSLIMRSGDHLRVERMLDRSSGLTEQALRNAADGSAAIAVERAALSDDSAGTCVVIAVAWAAVAVKVKLWVSGDDPESPAAASSLSRDELVHALATSLSSGA